MKRSDLEQLARVKRCRQQHTWQEIAEFFGMTWNAVRNQWRRKAKKLNPLPCPCPMCGDAEPEQADDREQVSWSEHGNYAEAKAQVGGEICSLEAFLEIVQPDLDTWRVLDWGVKRWEVGAKIKTGDLEFDDGRISGELHYRGLGKEGLWSVWAKFIRRKPIPIHPVVQPIQCDMVYPPPPKLAQGPGINTGLLIPDVQMGFERDLRTGVLRPFHDRRALDLSVQLAEALQPEVIVIMGDFQDLTMFTDKYVRSPEFFFTTQPSILEGHYYLRRLRQACPTARIYLLLGNHGARMEKMLSVHLVEACNLRAADELQLPPALSVPKLLALHELQVEWIGEYPDGEVWMGPLRVTHGERVSQIPGGSARAVVNDCDEHTAFGHVHRIELVSKRVRVRRGWRTVRAFSPGCLCHIDGRVPGSDAGDNWQQGLGVVEFTESAYTLHPVEITEGELIYDGILWRGKDYSPCLSEIWPEWNWHALH